MARRISVKAGLLAGLALAVPMGALAQANGPAEIPPASYQSREYVDSTGCVFIRAGVDGNVTWVPRVNRDRQPICGQTPSLAAQAPAPAPTPAPAPASTETVEASAPAVEPVSIPTPVETAPAVAVAPKSAPAIAAAPVRRVAPAPRRATSEPMRTVASAPRVKAAPAPVRVKPTGGSAIYSNTTPMVLNPGSSAGRVSDQADLHARVVPRHVYENRANTRVASPPAGYKPAWEDDRLNPRRAEGTLLGRQQMLLVWTNTVPRRLIEQRTGRDVTAKHPKLIYPFTDMRTQQAHLSTKGTAAPKKVIKPKAAQTKVRVAPKPKAVSGRYVQVATFANPSNAQATARKLQRSGLPVAMGRMTRKGKQYQLVLFGPLQAGQEQAALNAARRAGFADAFVR